MGKFVESGLVLFTILGLWACSGEHVNKWNSMDQWKNMENGEFLSPSAGVYSFEGSTWSYGKNNKDFKNFEFSAEILTDSSTVAGLFFQSDPSLLSGYEVLINNTYGADEMRKTGSLATVRNLYKTMAANGQWFTLNILVVGQKVVVRINEIPVVNYVQPGEPFRLPENATKVFGSGTFVLKNYSGILQMKNIQVKPLDEDTILPALAEEISEEKDDDIIELQQRNFPVIDFHVHLKGWSKEQAHANAMKTGIEYGIAPNCGIGFPITDDAGVYAYHDSTQHMPFFFAMQGEGREWVNTFSEEAMNQFDYVFTDALTFTDHKGRRTRLWIDDEVFIDIPQEKYMDLIVDKIIMVLDKEPIDVYVNPCFLPNAMLSDYDKLWTVERIQRVIDKLVEKKIALEINARYHIPNALTIKMAKQAGVKLAMGTNNGDPNIGKLEYCVQMIKECGITPQDLYFPAQMK
ncbi:MAG: DUF1080 domain-containing protein [Bacteroidales bacterium]|nr:DUF1080 domain-containing protein [Bacteroidales bacterium]